MFFRLTNFQGFLLALAVSLQSLLCVTGGAEQVASADTHRGVETELASLAQRAAVIFAGQVTAIERHTDVVEITFRVDRAVAGNPGPIFRLREWAGLWPQGQLHYTVGQRALVFLHGNSHAGFATSVNGPEGVVPILVSGADAPQLVNLQRVAAALPRALGSPLSDASEGTARLADVVSLIANSRTEFGVSGRLKPQYRLPWGKAPGARTGFPKEEFTNGGSAQPNAAQSLTATPVAFAGGRHDLR